MFVNLFEQRFMFPAGVFHLKVLISSKAMMCVAEHEAFYSAPAYLEHLSVKGAEQIVAQSDGTLLRIVSTLLVFTFHQVFELTDDMYKACREVSGAKTRMWEDLRALMRRFLVEDWQHLMDMLINENDYETTAIKRV
jgi:hypothetical protein